MVKQQVNPIVGPILNLGEIIWTIFVEATQQKSRLKGTISEKTI